MMDDVNTSGKLRAKLIAAPALPGDFTEKIEIDGLPGRMIGIVASVNTAPRAGEAGNRYTLFVRHLGTPPSPPPAAAQAAPTPPPSAAATPPPAADDQIIP